MARQRRTIATERLTVVRLGERSCVDTEVIINERKWTFQHLSLDANHETHTVKATLRRNQLRSELVGRYTCSEMINDRKYETIVHVFIQGRLLPRVATTCFEASFLSDGTSVFTKRLYPKVLQQTGIHFFNLPCQTTSWYPRMTCPTSTDAGQCQSRECSMRERQINELKCNIPICENQELCIPVYFTPADAKPTVRWSTDWTRADQYWIYLESVLWSTNRLCSGKSCRS